MLHVPFDDGAIRRAFLHLAVQSIDRRVRVVLLGQCVVKA